MRMMLLVLLCMILSMITVFAYGNDQSDYLHEGKLGEIIDKYDIDTSTIKKRTIKSLTTPFYLREQRKGSAMGITGLILYPLGIAAGVGMTVVCVRYFFTFRGALDLIFTLLLRVFGSFLLIAVTVAAFFVPAVLLTIFGWIKYARYKDKMVPDPFAYGNNDDVISSYISIKLNFNSL